MINWKDRIELGKSGLSLVRDASILGVIVALFAFPAWTNSRLFEAGVTNANLGILNWSNKARTDSLKIGAKIDKLKIENHQLSTEIARLKKENPALAPKLLQIERQIDQAGDNLAAAENAVKASVASQQTIIRKASPAADQLSGWIYLGAVSEDRTKWQGNPNVDTSWPVASGDTVTLNDTVYVRAGGQAGSRSLSKQIGVVKNGQKVSIQEIDASTHLIRSGWTVWARMRVE